MKSPKDIERQLANTHIRPRPEMRRRVLESAFQAQAEAESKRQAMSTSGSIWRHTMNSKMTRYAAAAVILITAMVVIHQLGGGLDGASVAWSQVVEQINSHTRYKCRQRVVREQGPAVPTMVVYHLSLAQRRQEVEDGSIHVIDMRGQDAITLELSPAEKKAVLTRLVGFGPRKDPDIIDMVRRFEQASTERLGTKEEGGKTLHGFRHAPNEHNDFTVWVDPDTKLPVEIELKHPSRKQTIFMDEFEFDFDLDESDFSTEIPDGYEVETIVEDYRPIEPKVVAPETLRTELSHTAYTLEKLPWMKTSTLVQFTDPLVRRGKVFVVGVRTDDDNCVLVVQNNYYTERRMVWLTEDRLVLTTPGGPRVFTHPNGAIYAKLMLEAIADVSPGLFKKPDLSEQRFTRMVAMPNGVVLGVCANQPLEKGRLLELAQSLKEIKTP